MKKSISRRPLQAKQKAELAALAAMPEEAIDTSETPKVLDWKGAERGLFYRPVKKQLTLRLDADLVAWFKSKASSSEGYQTGINRALREYIARKARKTGGQANPPILVSGVRGRRPDPHPK